MRKTCGQYHGAIDGEVYFDKAVWYKLNKITRPPRVRSAVPRLYSVRAIRLAAHSTVHHPIASHSILLCCTIVRCVFRPARSSKRTFRRRFLFASRPRG